MNRTFARTLGVALLYLIASAHVGSPDTWFEGKAGAYPVTVEVQTAGVVPGVAKVFVRVTGDQPSAITIQANKFDASGTAPPPEPTTPVEGDPGLYAGKLWIMSGGSNSVTINVNGAKGPGRVVVPVVVVAYSRLKLNAPMGMGLAAMGLFLFAGLVTIVGAAIREGSLTPGEGPTPRTIKRARTAMALTSVTLIALLAGGWRWWNSEDTAYERNMYKPLPITATFGNAGTSRAIQVSIADSSWIHRSDSAWLRRNHSGTYTPLVEDHGKLMHLFVISDDMSSFVHLHPATTDSIRFLSLLPTLSPGKYRVFADIVHESGFTHTMVSSITVGTGSLTAALPVATANPDDSWYTGPAAGPNAKVMLADGTTMEWKSGAGKLQAGDLAPLSFYVRNADGSPAALEPYMGMAGHAVVERNDASVFVHLHPMGTISMASQMAFAMRQPGDTIHGLLGKRVSDAEVSELSRAAVTSSTVSFPYAFPKAGRYRIWVQVKRAGKILTAAFDANVAEGAGSKS